MSEKIFELQTRSEHLTNGQRFAAINEINRMIQPLRNDLRHLEHQLFAQESNDEKIKKDIKVLEKQINDLENIKSDLETRINTETEHTRQELNNKIISFMSQELTPIENNKSEMQTLKTDMQGIKDDIHALRDEIREKEKNEEINRVARFDHFKIILTAVVAVLAALSSLSLFLEPSIRALINVFF